MSTPYRYTPLHEQSHQIRLLTLLPSNVIDQEDSHIRITLEIVQLTAENVPEFEALSYAWGSFEDRGEVLIVTGSGLQTLNVTQNLHDALLHLRYEAEPRVLWVDAICINQQDNPERSSQVKRMANIYTMSWRVLVWLGPEADDSSLALSLLESLGPKIEVDFSRWTMKAASEDPLERHWADHHQRLPFNSQEMGAVASLFKRSWFERLWIWQEIWLAGPSALVVCGSRTLLWANFRTACFCITTKPGLKEVSQNRRRALRHLVRKWPYRSFPSLLRETQLAKCADPRDRIFAVQSLLQPGDPVAEIEPDYTKSVSQVYREAFLLYTMREKTLRLMKRCEILQHRAELPTWLPNWSTPQFGTTMCQDLTAGYSPVYIEQINESIIRAHGITLDVIGSVAGPHVGKKDSGSVIRGIVDHFRVSETEVQAFCHAIFLGNFADYHFFETTNDDSAPRLVDAVECISNIISAAKFEYDKLPVIHRRILNRGVSVSRNRLIYKTAHGRFGMAPNGAEPGDIVVALLGFDSALILRRVDGNMYKVVGESYCYGYMCCEGFLGPLPNSYKMVWVTDERTKNRPHYLNMRSGVLEIEDPRLGKLPEGWKIEHHEKKRYSRRFLNEKSGERTQFDPRLLPEELLARGVHIQYFDLI